MAQPYHGPVNKPPHTGFPALDEACAAVADLSAVPVAQHADRLTRAHEAVSAALANAPLVPAPANPPARR